MPTPTRRPGHWTRSAATSLTWRPRSAGFPQLAYQLVGAHGSNGGGCGWWSPGYATKVGVFSRASFHGFNHRYLAGNVCDAVAEDRSCYGGKTALAIAENNNLGAAAQCDPPGDIDHSRHAAFLGDMAISPGPANDVTYNLEAITQDLGMSAMIQETGRNGNYGTLASGLRIEATTEASPSSGFDTEGRYSDRGYNRTPGSHCEDASHHVAH